MGLSLDLVVGCRSQSMSMRSDGVPFYIEGSLECHRLLELTPSVLSHITSAGKPKCVCCRFMGSR